MLHIFLDSPDTGLSFEIFLDNLRALRQKNMAEKHDLNVSICAIFVIFVIITKIYCKIYRYTAIIARILKISSFPSQNAPLRGSFPAIFFVWLVGTSQKLSRTKRLCLGYEGRCMKHFCDAYKDSYQSRKSDLALRHFFRIFWGGGLKNLPLYKVFSHGGFCSEKL